MTDFLYMVGGAFFILLINGIINYKKSWVGLTDEEVEAYYCWEDFQVGCGPQTLFDMVRDIEAKLKEKNT